MMGMTPGVVCLELKWIGLDNGLGEGWRPESLGGAGAIRPSWAGCIGYVLGTLSSRGLVGSWA